MEAAAMEEGPASEKRPQRLRWLLAPGLALLLLLLAALGDWALRQPQPLFGPLLGILVVIFFAVQPQDLPCGCYTVPLNMMTAPVATLGLLLLAGMQASLLWEAPLGTEALCPLQVMAVFYGMAYLCLSANETGLLRNLAQRAALAAPGRTGAFLSVALVAAAMTLLTSNDVVVLTLTPVVVHLCAQKGYDPLPFLYLEFATANIWSVSLLIGNPTNVIAAGPAGLSFGRYFLLLGPAGIISGFVAVGLIYLRFMLCGQRRQEEGMVSPEEGPSPPVAAPRRAALAAVRLFLTLGFASLDDWHGVPLWVTAAVAGGASLLMDALLDVCATDSSLALAALRCMPWEVFPFAMSLFIMVQALDLAGLVGLLARAATAVATHGVPVTVAAVGAASMLACQLLNNQPMTVLFAKVLSHEDFQAGEKERLAAFGALIVGSNLGANVTLIGALAGPMWVKVCKGLGVHISHGQFIKAMLCTTPGVAAAGLTAFTVQLWLLG